MESMSTKAPRKKRLQPGRKPLPPDERLISRGLHLRARQWEMLTEVLDAKEEETGKRVTQREFFSDYVERQHRKLFPDEHEAKRARSY
jgi:hypothetical protein